LYPKFDSPEGEDALDDEAVTEGAEYAEVCEAGAVETDAGVLGGTYGLNVDDETG
jgi:hypothetical protein